MSSDLDVVGKIESMILFFSLCLLSRDGEENCRKQLGRVLSIWQERAVYDSSLLDQLSAVLCKLPH